MPRKPTVWFRKQDGWFYTTVAGDQIKPSRDRAEAEREFYAVLATRDRHPEPRLVRVSLRKLVDEFLEWTIQHNIRTTYTWRRRTLHLQSLLDFVPRGLKAADLTVRQVERWAESKPTWCDNTRVKVKVTVLTCMNWAVRRQLLKENPLRTLGVGIYQRAERILSREERDAIRGYVRGREFKNFLRVLELTGARPFSEIASLTGDMVDFEAGVIEFRKHKNAKKGKKRVIYLTPEVGAILREQVEKRPEGLLFRTFQGYPIDSRSVSHRLRGAAKELGLKPLTVYAYRHSFITEALERGLPASVVAQLVGNSAKTIERYYDHLDQKKEALRKAALLATE